MLASANGAGQYGTTLTVSVPNVTAGEKFYVLVQGADTTQMGTGRYALGLNFKGATPPTEASPIVAVPNGNPQHAGGGQADGADGNGPYGSANPVITGITPRQRRQQPGRRDEQPEDLDPRHGAGPRYDHRLPERPGDRPDDRPGEQHLDASITRRIR